MRAGWYRAMRAKLTEARAERIVQAVRLGASRDVVAEVAGIDRRTLRRWLERGATAGAPKPYAEFAARVHKAEATARRAKWPPTRSSVEARLRLMHGTSRLAGGDVGYIQRRADDCLRAAVATTLQVPIERVPDPRIDARLRAGKDAEDVRVSVVRMFEAWTARRGLRIVASREPGHFERRWIGIVLCEPPFTNHCLVMDGEELVFDVAAGLACPPGLTLKVWGPERIKIAMDFERA